MEEIQTAINGLEKSIQALEEHISALNQAKSKASERALELQYVIKTTSDRLEALIHQAEKKE